MASLVSKTKVQKRETKKEKETAAGGKGGVLPCLSPLPQVTVLQRMAQDHVEVGSNILVVIRVNPYPGRQLQGQGPPIHGRGASCGRGTHMAPNPAVAPSGQF
ncbi:hypothetical protein Q8A73_000105 [Channa argus]|nr:hypothetical protein Q8A73_000105 [Channa argus]